MPACSLVVTDPPKPHTSTSLRNRIRTNLPSKVELTYLRYSSSGGSQIRQRCQQTTVLPLTSSRRARSTFRAEEKIREIIRSKWCDALQDKYSLRPCPSQGLQVQVVEKVKDLGPLPSLSLYPHLPEQVYLHPLPSGTELRHLADRVGPLVPSHFPSVEVSSFSSSWICSRARCWRCDWK